MKKDKNLRQRGNLDSLVKSQGSGRLCKKLQVQGAQILSNEAYFNWYAAMTKDEAERRRWTFYEAVNLKASANQTGDRVNHTCPHLV